MWWEPCPLHALDFAETAEKKTAAGKVLYRLTRWCLDMEALAELRKDIDFKPVAGEHYEVDEEFIRTTWSVPDQERYAIYLAEAYGVSGVSGSYASASAQWFLH